MQIPSVIVKQIGWALLGLFVFLLPTPTFAVFNEQISINARAISLANTCTADPPGVMSVHYNPAGLSLLDEGKTSAKGYTLPYIKRTGYFKAADDFEGFMDGRWGPDPNKWPKDWKVEDDPDRDHGGDDPLAGKSGTNSSARMYIPFYGPIDFAFSSFMGLASRKPNSRWTFAHANYAPYGGGMRHKDSGDPYRFAAKAFYNQHLIYMGPTASYAVSDTLSLGVSIGMAQRAMGVEVDVRAPNQLVALTRVIGDATKDLNIPVVSQQTLPPPWLGGGQGPYEHALTMSMDLRDDFVPSVNLGLLWRPKSWFSYGFCYQSESVAELTGKYIFEYSEQFQNQVHWSSLTPMTMQSAGMLDMPINKVPYQSGTVTSTQTLPNRVQTGIMVRPLDRIKFLFDVHWANWYRAGKETRFEFDQRIQILRRAKLLGYAHGANTYVSERNMQDTWHWSTGMEFMVNDKLTLRCGYEKRPTSLQHDQFDSMMFIPDADFVGAGFGLKMPSGVDIDFGLGYLWSNHFMIYNNESTNMNSTDFTQSGNAFTGLDVRQDLSIYMVSFAVSMPLEVKKENARKKKEKNKLRIKKIKALILKLNPFKKEKENEIKQDEADDTRLNTLEEDDFNRYLERLSAEYH